MTFDFSKVTLGDVRKLSAGDMSTSEVIDFCDKVVVGGVVDLPFEQWGDVTRDIFAEFQVWMISLQEDKTALSDLLKDVKGL